MSTGRKRGARPPGVLIVTPSRPGSATGNGVTAQRWARILRALGRRVKVATAYEGRPCGLLIALHAGRSAASIERYRRERGDAPLIVALTGTDLYGEIRTSPVARRSLELATRLVVLQPLGLGALPARLRRKARVILQSVEAIAPPARRSAASFDVCVLSNLRAVKDPLRTAEAARLLPAASRVRVLHLGRPLEQALLERAVREPSLNPRYRYLGERPRPQALRLLARCRLLSLTSRLEGGANVVSEAIAAGVPVVASRIPGSLGLLGRDYPGYFPAGNTRALARLLRRTETDAAFREDLARRCRMLRPLFAPARERSAWRALLAEVEGGARGGSARGSPASRTRPGAGPVRGDGRGRR
jgi:putative glycosyltransferase (TIGR04348 family)